MFNVGMNPREVQNSPVVLPFTSGREKASVLRRKKAGKSSDHILTSAFDREQRSFFERQAFYIRVRRNQCVSPARVIDVASVACCVRMVAPLTSARLGAARHSHIAAHFTPDTARSSHGRGSQSGAPTYAPADQSRSRRSRAVVIHPATARKRSSHRIATDDVDILSTETSAVFQNLLPTLKIYSLCLVFYRLSVYWQ